MRTVLLLLGATALVCSLPAQTPSAPKMMRASAAGSSFIGVMVQEIDADRAKTLKLHEEAGVEVTRVEPDSPAEHAGLKIGDVIMQYNGLHVEGMEQFSRLVHETPAGREVKLDIIRAGMPQVVTARIGARRPAPFAALQAPPTERF